MAHFMRGQLADARERGLIQNFGLLIAVGVGRKQAFEDQVILPVAQGAEGDRPLDNFAGARIGDRAAGTTSRAWNGAPS